MSWENYRCTACYQPGAVLSTRGLYNNMPEYLKYRCCMCPSDKPENPMCYPPKDFRDRGVKECRFVKVYVDNRGWKYKVMGGLGESNYKTRYQKPGASGWKCMANMEWRKSFDQAQSDLNAIAKLKKWDEV